MTHRPVQTPELARPLMAAAALALAVLVASAAPAAAAGAGSMPARVSGLTEGVPVGTWVDAFAGGAVVASSQVDNYAEPGEPPVIGYVLHADVADGTVLTFRPRLAEARWFDVYVRANRDNAYVLTLSDYRTNLSQPDPDFRTLSGSFTVDGQPRPGDVVNVVAPGGDVVAVAPAVPAAGGARSAVEVDVPANVPTVTLVTGTGVVLAADLPVGDAGALRGLRWDVHTVDRAAQAGVRDGGGVSRVKAAPAFPEGPSSPNPPTTNASSEPPQGRSVPAAAGAAAVALVAAAATSARRRGGGGR